MDGGLIACLDSMVPKYAPVLVLALDNWQNAVALHKPSVATSTWGWFATLEPLSN